MEMGKNMGTDGAKVTRRVLLTGSGAAPVAELLSHRAKRASGGDRPTLYRGQSGATVKTAQARLNALGYWVGTPDGTFGHVTQQAVWALQKANRVSRTGKITDTEWWLLDHGRRPTPRATSGTLIEVDIQRQILMVVSGGKLYRTLNTSTGSGERYYSGGSWKTARTPTGSYSIYWRWANGWQTGQLGSMWRPTYWKGDFAIHGSQSIPPYPASHGCCRVSTAAMDMLWAGGWVSLKRRVVLY